MGTCDSFDRTLLGWLEQAGAPRVVSLQTLHDRPRSSIRRLQLAATWHGHDRIIAKQTVGSGAIERFNRELASLRLLSSPGINPPVAPRLLACDASTRILFLNDLGDHGLAAVLREQDRAAARAALIAYASALGRMHAATARNEQHNGCLNAPCNLHDLKPSCVDFRALCDATGVVVDSAFDADTAKVETVLNNPGPFHAFTHGDPCPDNERLTADGVAFIDFETGGFDHALLDAAYLGMAFPTCWCVGTIPPKILAEMHAKYRRALTIRAAAVEDDGMFNRHLLHASARWLLDPGTLVQRSNRSGKNHFLTLLESDWKWGPATARQRLMHRLQAFLQLAETTHDLHGITTTAGRLHNRLSSRWPDNERQLAAYPAFQNSSQLSDRSDEPR